MALFDTAGPVEGKGVTFATDEAAVPPITRWSYTALAKFRICPMSIFLSKVMKYEEVTKNEAMERGNKIHKMAEDYVQGEILDLPKELSKFQDKFEWLREEYLEGNVTIEHNWGFDKDWNPVSWRDKNCWAMIKLDASVKMTSTEMLVIDHKTGKKFGNEMKHRAQGLVYVVGTFMQYPEVDYVRFEFWYLDQGQQEKVVGEYTREQMGQILLPRIEKQAHELTDATKFPPQPSVENCRFCPHKENGKCDYSA